MSTTGGHPYAVGWDNQNQKEMGLGHEKLDVYRLAINYVALVYEKAEVLTGIHLTVMLSRLGDRSYCVQEDCN
jgi:hypothetical protein